MHRLSGGHSSKYIGPGRVLGTGYSERVLVLIRYKSLHIVPCVLFVSMPVYHPRTFNLGQRFRNGVVRILSQVSRAMPKP